MSLDPEAAAMRRDAAELTPVFALTDEERRAAAARLGDCATQVGPGTTNAMAAGR